MFDRRTLLALGLIAVIFALWAFFFMPKPASRPPAPQQTAQSQNQQTGQAPAQTPAAPPQAPQAPAPVTPARYSALANGANHYVTIETPHYKAMLNTRGALLARMELKNYRAWYGAPVQLINDSAGFPGVLALSFTGVDGHPVSTENLAYTLDAPENIKLGEKDSAVVVARLTLGGTTDSAGAAAPVIEKRFVFHGDSYGVGLDVAFRNMAGELAATNPTYELTWRDGVKYQEHNSMEESAKSDAVVSVNGDHTQVDWHDVGKSHEEKFAGNVEWVGVHVKYFGAAIIPQKPIANGSASVDAIAATADSSGTVEHYTLGIAASAAGGNVSQHFTVFAGPMEYDVVHDLGITPMIALGNSITRPISEFILLPLFRFLHSFIGNWGLVIIVFSLIIRIVLWPLSIPQIRSSRKMQLLQPKIAELREQYANDQQRQQMETMKVYREYGINPMGGCLPMVLQLPILYALYNTLSTAIDLRQTQFALWIHDLSVPDYIVQLPWHLPLIGSSLSAMALIMGTTLFLQQRMMITDPKQKALVYLMPVMLTIAFTNLPSGLNLYYLTFNILAIGQQVYMTKFAKNQLTLEQMRAEAKNRKKGWLAQKMEQAQKMAEAQQKAQQGSAAKKVDGRTPVEQRKRS
ncbi:MAG TPA: membrane protein insertase YidC [Candidatus Kapabacteria bacterium]|nr:membrane protein insertase YidC [Candidatus Kapabacteria bacterium]